MPKTKGESKASPVLKDKDTPRTRRSKEKKEKEAKSRVSKEKELDGDAAASSPRSLRSFHFPSLPKKRSRGLVRVLLFPSFACCVTTSPSPSLLSPSSVCLPAITITIDSHESPCAP